MVKHHDVGVQKFILLKRIFNDNMDNKWSNMTTWFQDGLDRKSLVKKFNIAAKASFINGSVPALLKCSITKGFKPYKHSNSALFFTGIRIVAYTNSSLSELELNILGHTVLAEKRIVRLLVSLGWDTLEVGSDIGENGLRWKLIDFVNPNQ